MTQRETIARVIDRGTQNFTRAIDTLAAHPNKILALVFLVISLFAALAAFEKLRPPQKGAGNIYIIMAADMLAQSNSGTKAEHPPADPATKYGRPPAYGLLLHTLATWDDQLAAAILCEARSQRCTENGSFFSLVLLQLIASIAGLYLTFLIAHHLSKSWAIAMLTFLLTFEAVRVGEFASSSWPTVWWPILGYLWFYLAVLAQSRGNLILSACSGACLGASTLFLPLWIVMLPVAAAIIFWSKTRHRSLTKSLLQTTIFCIAAIAAIFTGITYAHTFAIDTQNEVYRHLTYVFSERAAFQSTDLFTRIVSLFYPIPFIGELVELILPSSITSSMELSGANSIWTKGNLEIAPKALANDLPPVDQYKMLLQTYIAGDILNYITTLPSFFMRGIWAGADIIAIMGLTQLWPMMKQAKQSQDQSNLLLLLVPTAALFLTNLLFTANHYFLNPVLPFIYAYAIAVVAGSFSFSNKTETTQNTVIELTHAQ